MNCKTCGSKTNKAFSAKVLNKYDADYNFCSNCNFLFAVDPFWLKESYQNSINISDTGILQRNIYFSKIISVILYFFYNKDDRFLDYAGGYGIFARLMRDIGFDFYWHDPYCQNLLSRGFEFNEPMEKEIKLITAFEVFEHFVNPVEEIEKMTAISGSIAFSTTLLPNLVPEKNWWYYAFEHGQHISFYSDKTLKYIAQKMNLNFYSFKGIHLLANRKLNDALLKTSLALCNAGLFQVVKKNMKGKTWEDHLLLKENNIERKKN